MSIFSHFQQRFESTRRRTLCRSTELCKNDRSAYVSAAERLLMAIGEPELLDTSTNSRLSRIFSNKVIRRYPAFEDFHGMEECIDQIVSYFRHAAQGTEEKKQILYLLGPVGGGKSSLAEKLKQLMEKVPFYAIKGSPVFESPLGLFNATEDGAILEEDFGIPRRYLNTIMSPWATKRPPNSAATSVSSAWSSCTRRSSIRLRWPRPNPVTRTTRHLGAGRQGRYPQTRRIPAERR